MPTRTGSRRPRTPFVVAASVLIAALVPASVVWSSHAANADQPPRAPSGLTVDDDAAPLAVEGVPQFGWQVVDPRRGQVQTAYQLLVSRVPTTDPRAASVIWTSGRVHSSQQSYVDVP